MAEETSKRDPNRITGGMAVTDNAAAELRRLLVDPTTGRLKVTATLSGSNVGLEAVATIGADTLFDSDGDNTAQAIKTSAGALYGLEVSNPNSADAFIQLFNVATGSVTVGSTTPKISFFVPAGDGTKDGAMDKMFPVPMKFSTAITYACTTTVTGSGDPTTGLIVNAYFK